MTQRQRKIKVINFMPALMQSGGIESFWVNSASALKDEAVEYVILTPSRSSTVFDKRFESLGVKFEYLSNRKIKKNEIKILFGKYVRHNKDAIIHIHWGGEVLYLYALIAKLNGCKRVICHVHSVKTDKNEVERLKRFRNSFFASLFSWTPDYCIACSEDAGNQVFRRHSFLYIKNGIDPERFRFDDIIRQKKRNELNLEGRYVIGQIGRFSPPKNQFFTLNLIKKCRERGLEIVCVLVGEGEDYEKICEYISDNKLESYALIAPPIENVEDYYQIFDVLIFPSNWEGFGIVALEGKCAGLPMLCSEYIINDVMIGDMNFRLKLCDYEDWISVILYLMNTTIDRENNSETAIIECESKGLGLSTLRSNLLKAYSSV